MSKSASTEAVALRDKRQNLFSLSLLFIVELPILLPGNGVVPKAG